MSKIWEEITKETWTQESEARDSLDQVTMPLSRDAVKWCALGWIMKNYPSEYQIALDLFKEANNIPIIAKWNDDPERTFEEVQAKFKEADL